MKNVKFLPCGAPIHLSMWGVVGYVGGPLNVWWIHFFLEGTPHEKVNSPGYGKVDSPGLGA